MCIKVEEKWVSSLKPDFWNFLTVSDIFRRETWSKGLSNREECSGSFSKKFQKKFSCTTSFETASQHWFRNSFRNDSSTYHFLSILWNTTYTHYLHTNECNRWVQKHPKFSKFLKKTQNLNWKPVLESGLVTDFYTVLGFLCLASEVPFFGYPKDWF